MDASLVRKNLQTKPKEETHWTIRAIARETWLSRPTVQRILQAFGLQPHRQRQFRNYARLCPVRFFSRPYPGFGAAVNDMQATPTTLFPPYAVVRKSDSAFRILDLSAPGQARTRMDADDAARRKAATTIIPLVKRPKGV
jgi:hypothetical protein